MSKNNRDRNMKQEDKQLLLKDICARLPYKVKGVYARTDIKNLSICEITTHLYGEMEESFNGKEKYEFIPYLRPLSSMTEEEKDELYTAMDWYGNIDEFGNVYTKGQEKVYRETFYEYTDWLNAHHFDYRGLIEKGLALEAPDNMYKNE